MPRVQCKFVREDGTQCKSTYTREEWGWHCFAHARSLGLREKATWTWKNKRKGSKVEPRKVQALSETEILDALKAEPYDVSKGFVLANAQNPLPNVDRGVEKYVFARWLVADKGQRSPQSVDEVSELIGVPVSTLDAWVSRGDLLDIFEVHRKRDLRKVGRLIDTVLLEKASNGEKWAIELYYEVTKFREVAEDEQKEADNPLRRSLKKGMADAVAEGFGRVVRELGGAPRPQAAPVQSPKSLAGKAIKDAMSLHNVEGMLESNGTEEAEDAVEEGNE